MNLIEVPHRFKSTAWRRDDTDMVVVHHSYSGDVSAATIHGWHLDRGFFGIGYHFVIRKNGAIETGRPIDTVGAHAGRAANRISIGVCLTGNFEHEPPTEEQYKSLGQLDREIIKPRYGILPYIGHSKYMATACPGKYFDFDILAQERIKPPDVTILFNGIPSAIPSRIENGRTKVKLSGHWVELRSMVDMIPGATIGWDGQTRTVDVVIQ